MRKTITSKYTFSGTQIVFGIAFMFLLSWGNIMKAQCDAISNDCEMELEDFLSDGQYYRVQVGEGEKATMKITLYEGFTYRVIACTDSKSGHVNYAMYDGKKRKVFSANGDNDGVPWDFEIGATDEFTLEANLTKGMGCIVFEIGFNDEMFIDDDDLLEDDDPFFEDELEDDIEVDLENDDIK